MLAGLRFTAAAGDRREEERQRQQQQQQQSKKKSGKKKKQKKKRSDRREPTVHPISSSSSRSSSPSPVTALSQKNTAASPTSSAAAAATGGRAATAVATVAAIAGPAGTEAAAAEAAPSGSDAWQQQGVAALRALREGKDVFAFERPCVSNESSSGSNVIRGLQVKELNPYLAAEGTSSSTSSLQNKVLEEIAAPTYSGNNKMWRLRQLRRLQQQAAERAVPVQTLLQHHLGDEASAALAVLTEQPLRLLRSSAAAAQEETKHCRILPARAVNVRRSAERAEKTASALSGPQNKEAAAAAASSRSAQSSPSPAEATPSKTTSMRESTVAPAVAVWKGGTAEDYRRTLSAAASDAAGRTCTEGFTKETREEEEEAAAAASVAGKTAFLSSKDAEFFSSRQEVRHEEAHARKPFFSSRRQFCGWQAHSTTKEAESAAAGAVVEPEASRGVNAADNDSGKIRRSSSGNDGDVSSGEGPTAEDARLLGQSSSREKGEASAAARWQRLPQTPRRRLGGLSAAQVRQAENPRAFAFLSAKTPREKRSSSSSSSSSGHAQGGEGDNSKANETLRSRQQKSQQCLSSSQQGDRRSQQQEHQQQHQQRPGVIMTLSGSTASQSTTSGNNEQPDLSSNNFAVAAAVESSCVSGKKSGLTASEADVEENLDLNTLASRSLKAKLTGDMQLYRRLQGIFAKKQLLQGRELLVQETEQQPQKNASTAAIPQAAGVHRRPTAAALPYRSRAETCSFYSRQQQQQQQGGSGAAAAAAESELRLLLKREKSALNEDDADAFQAAALLQHNSRGNMFDAEDVAADALIRMEGGHVNAKKRKLQEKLKDQRMNRLNQRLHENCSLCVDSPVFERLRSRCLISMSPHAILAFQTFRECVLPIDLLLFPAEHCGAITQLSEDSVYEELRNFQKNLTLFFSQRGESPVFIETVTHHVTRERVLQGHGPHACIHVLPILTSRLQEAKTFFRQAFEEAEGEWQQHRKVIEVKGRESVRAAIPPNFTYIHVDFALSGGLAHIIEDGKLFPKNFGRDVLTGMLEMNSTDRAFQRETDYQDAIRNFRRSFAPFDWTET